MNYYSKYVKTKLRKQKKQKVSFVMKHLVQPIAVVTLCSGILMSSYSYGSMTLASSSIETNEAAEVNDMEQRNSYEEFTTVSNNNNISPEEEITSVEEEEVEESFTTEENQEETTVEAEPEEETQEISPQDIVISYNDISIKSGATKDMIELAVKDTWLEPYGNLFYELEQEYSINAFIAIANAIQETGWDINDSYIATNYNNIYGMKDKRFSSKEECIRYYFQLMNEYYVGAGLKDMDSINRKYCPPNDEWAPDIYSIAKKLNTKVSNTHT